MKKTIVLSMLTLMTALAVSIHAKAQKGFYISAQGGRQLSVMLNKDDVHKEGMDLKAKSSYAAGVGAGYNFTPTFGVATELVYSVERQRYSDNAVQYTQELQYIKVPVLLAFNSSPGAAVSFTAKAGPQLGIRRGASITDASKAGIAGSNKDQFRNLTMGAMIGGGARIRITEHLFAEGGLRFDGTFTNTENEKHSSYAAGRPASHNLNAGAEVGIKYFLN